VAALDRALAAGFLLDLAGLLPLPPLSRYRIVAQIDHHVRAGAAILVLLFA
jgi:hypothetical protein